MGEEHEIDLGAAGSLIDSHCDPTKPQVSGAEDGGRRTALAGTLARGDDHVAAVGPDLE